MQSAEAAQISDDIVRARLLDEIGKVKSLTSGASPAGVRVHTLPTKPKDIEDDGLFHYAVMPPSASSDSGKPSAEAKRFLDETTGSEKPRVFRNAVLLLTPSKDGLSAAEARVRDYLAWERVIDELTPKNEEEKEQKGSVDVARLQTLKINIDKAKARVPEAIRQGRRIRRGDGWWHGRRWRWLGGCRNRVEKAGGPGGPRAVGSPGLGRSDSAVAGNQEQSQHAARIPRASRGGLWQKRSGCRIDECHQQIAGRHSGGFQNPVDSYHIRSVGNPVPPAGGRARNVQDIG